MDESIRTVLRGLLLSTAWSYPVVSITLPPHRYTSIPSYRFARNRVSYFNASMPSRSYAYSVPLELQTSVPLFLHVCTPPALHASASTRLPHASRPAYLCTSIPLKYQVTSPQSCESSMPPCLHVATPTASLQTSIPPCLHRRYTYSEPPELHAPWRHVATLTASLQSSIPPCLHVVTPTSRL